MGIGRLGSLRTFFFCNSTISFGQSSLHVSLFHGRRSGMDNQPPLISLRPRRILFLQRMENGADSMMKYVHKIHYKCTICLTSNSSLFCRRTCIRCLLVLVSELKLSLQSYPRPSDIIGCAPGQPPNKFPLTLRASFHAHENLRKSSNLTSNSTHTRSTHALTVKSAREQSSSTRAKWYDPWPSPDCGSEKRP